MITWLQLWRIRSGHDGRTAHRNRGDCRTALDIRLFFRLRNRLDGGVAAAPSPTRKTGKPACENRYRTVRPQRPFDRRDPVGQQFGQHYRIGACDLCLAATLRGRGSHLRDDGNDIAHRHICRSSTQDIRDRQSGQGSLGGRTDYPNCRYRTGADHLHHSMVRPRHGEAVRHRTR